MPPRKQPMSLQDLSLKSVERLAMELCGNIDREHGRRKCQARRDKLAIGKTYLSPIQHLFDDLLKVVLHNRPSDKAYLYEMVPQHPRFNGLAVDDKTVILELLICDRVTTLDLGQLDPSNRCLSNTPSFWKKLFLKLKNVVNLNIQGVRMTDALFRAIGDVCTNLRKLQVTSEHSYAFMESMGHVLKCRELRELTFAQRVGKNADSIKNSEVNDYLRKLVMDLPKLEYICAWLPWNSYGPLTKQFPSMRKLLVHPCCADLENVIRACPNVTDLDILFREHFSSTMARPTGKSVEQDKVLNVLAESPLQLTSLKLTEVAISKELTNMFTCKGAHLTSLEIIVGLGNRISVNDVYTIGVSCPRLVELRLKVSSEWMRLAGKTWPAMEEQTFVSTPPMFVRLKLLELTSFVDWDQRILPLILRHADNLASIILVNVFEPSNGPPDPVLQILDASTLQRLECLHIQARSYNGRDYWEPFNRASIERLVDCCRELVKISLEADMGNPAFHYLLHQQESMKRDNFDFISYLAAF